MKLTSKMIAILVNDIMVSKKENVRRVITELLDEAANGYSNDCHLLNLLLGDVTFKTVESFPVKHIKANKDQFFHNPAEIITDSIRVIRVENVYERISVGYKKEGSDYEYSCYISFDAYNEVLVKKD